MKESLRGRECVVHVRARGVENERVRMQYLCESEACDVSYAGTLKRSGSRSKWATAAVAATCTSRGTTSAQSLTSAELVRAARMVWSSWLWRRLSTNRVAHQNFYARAR